ncbi:MAG: 23S rRNA (adenine(2503)-C(2))-methyltransferase RlmN [Bacteroidia bacterium]|nr:23S rRNA (adenine(2503)-C(2))-methyltransferase RlmN [Bacteroidia bacterium]
MRKEHLFGKKPDEIENIARELALPKYATRQLIDWIYKKKITSIDEMSNLSKQVREKLNERFDLGLLPPVKEEVSADGTKKYLFPTHNGKFVETAVIPEKERLTVCVSTQVGCKMGCLFCMTGKQGFHGNLTATEIINQIHSLPEKDKITNIVYMGMGEPFDNLQNVLESLEILTSGYGYAMSPRRITVSTIGIIPAIVRFMEESKCHLAISLHSPFEEERSKLMPVENVYSLTDMIKTIQEYDFTKQQRISFEYIMFKGVNDMPKHIKELTRLLNKIKCRINLIRFHPIPGSPLRPSDEASIELFKNSLNDKSILTTIRKSRGQDISAACGMLSTNKDLKI